MKIKKNILQNFRRYKEWTEIPLNDLTAFIGKNDVGKSSILEALDIFFDGGTIKIEPGDASISGDAKNVLIGVAFSDFPQQLTLDSGAQSTLEAEHLLNADGQLEIHKVHNCAVQRVGAAKIFARAVHPTADGAKELIQKPNKELKQIIKDRGLEAKCKQNENPSMRQAIYQDVGELQLQEQDVPLNEENGKAIWAAIEKYLPVYALFKSDRPSTDQDSEVQNPMKVAIQKAIKGMDAELEAVTEKIREQAQKTADRTLEQLQASYPELAKSLRARFQPPKWANIFKLDLESDEGIPLNKRGSGVRRLVLLSFFQAEAARKKEERQGTGEEGVQVIYAIEEPETSQHPDSLMRIMQALRAVAGAGDQVLLTTHVPALASLVPADSLRFVDDEPATGQVRIRSGTPEVFSEIAETLGVLPDAVDKPGAKVAVLVEGPTDVDVICSFAEVLAGADEIEAIDFSKVFFAPGGGETLKFWVERRYLDTLGLPQIFLFDSDRTAENLPAKASKQRRETELNARDNCQAFMTRKREIENYVHPDAISRLTDGKVVLDAGVNLDFDDIETIFSTKLSAALNDGKWQFEATDRFGNRIAAPSSNAKKVVTGYVMRKMTAEEIKERCKYVDEASGETRYEVVEWLEAIQEHAR